MGSSFHGSSHASLFPLPPLSSAVPKIIASGLSRAEFQAVAQHRTSQVVAECAPLGDGVGESIPVTIEWRNLTLHAQTPAGPKAILRGLTGHASPGELVAIMGPSGAGKTTLLNCLAQRAPGYGGEVLLNGVPWRENFFSILAYMPQDEMFLGELTPREHLTFMSKFRLHGLSEGPQAARVATVIGEMQLEGVADKLIGDPNSEAGLTRNERKRLNFATETLTEPSLLYVDEPTTGLDSVMAASVVKQLKAMACGTTARPFARTVLATIHQPSLEIFKLFDKLYFVVDGRAAYFGPTVSQDLSAYFGKLGHPMPAGSAPSDFIMELVVDPANRSEASMRRKEICDRFATLEEVGALSANSNDALTKVGAVVAAPGWVQFKLLCQRDLVMRKRTPVLTKAILGRNVILGLLLGLCLFRINMSQTKVYSITGALFFGTVTMIMPAAVGHISTLPLQLPCVVREVRSNGYSAYAYFATKFVSDIPIDVIGAVIFSVLIFFLTGLANDSVEVWLKMLAVYIAANFLGNSIGQWAAILAPPGVPFVGLVATLLLIIPQFLFAGVLINLEQIPVWWSWMSEVSVFRYFLELVMTIQWEDYGMIPCDMMEVNGNSIEICPFPDGDEVLSFYGMGSKSKVQCALIITLWWFIFKCLGLQILLKRCRPATSAFGGRPPDDATAETMPSSDAPNTLLEAPNEDAENGSAAASGPIKRRALKPISLAWRNMGFSATIKDPGGGKGGVTKTVLSDLSGNAEPGELIAVMGGSGSGKSTLLKCLSQRQLEGNHQGRVTFNGFSKDEYGPTLKKTIAFLEQEDHFIAELTVQEHLIFHASLRMDQNIFDVRRLERVDEIIGSLGLSKAKHTLIGAIGSGISGGERRRLSYASEILQEASLLLCDEPTSGLDSSMAEMVVRTLRAAADSGCTVLCCIHQPSKRVLDIFDKLLLLSSGETAFMGPVAGVLDYFGALGFPLQPKVDPVEHFMSLVAGSDLEGARSVAVASARKDAVALTAPKKKAHPSSNGESTLQFDSSWKEQLRALLKREFTMRKRSAILTKATIGRTIGVSVLVSTIYWQVDKDQQGVFSITGALSFIVINHVFTYVIGQSVAMPDVLPTLRRESQANMYSVNSWYLSKSISDLPFDLGTTLLLATVIYWCVGFTDDIENFVTFLVLLAFGAILSTGFGHLMGTLAFVLGKPELSVALCMLFLFPMFLFSGLLINFNDVPDGLVWLQYSSIFYYAFSLVFRNQWVGYGDIGCSKADAAATGMGRCAFMTGDDVLAYFGVEDSNAVRDIVVIVVMAVACRVGCLLLIKARAMR